MHRRARPAATAPAPGRPSRRRSTGAWSFAVTRCNDSRSVGRNHNISASFGATSCSAAARSPAAACAFSIRFTIFGPASRVRRLQLAAPPAHRRRPPGRPARSCAALLGRGELLRDQLRFQQHAAREIQRIEVIVLPAGRLDIGKQTRQSLLLAETLHRLPSRCRRAPRSPQTPVPQPGAAATATPRSRPPR